MMYWLGGAFGCTTLETHPPHVIAGRDSASSKTRSSLTTTLDRTHWPAITVQPADGTTPHGLLLFYDLAIKQIDANRAVETTMKLDLSQMKLPAEDFSRVNENVVENENNLIKAMKNTQPENWSKSNSLHLLAQPLKVTLDLATFPFRHIARTTQEETQNPPD